GEATRARLHLLFHAGDCDVLKGRQSHAVGTLCQHISLWHLSLHLSCGTALGQSDPLRPGALYLEERFLPIAAGGGAPPRLEPVPLRYHRCNPRPFRRVPGARVGGELGTRSDPAPADGDGRRRHRRPKRHHWTVHSDPPASRRSAHPAPTSVLGLLLSADPL